MPSFSVLFHLIRCLIAPRLRLAAEIVSLRQQLAVLNRSTKRPQLRWQDRFFWALLSKLWKDWREVLVIVKPETVVKRRNFIEIEDQFPTQCKVVLDAIGRLYEVEAETVGLSDGIFDRDRWSYRSSSFTHSIFAPRGAHRTFPPAGPTRRVARP